MFVTAAFAAQKERGTRTATRRWRGRGGDGRWLKKDEDKNKNKNKNKDKWEGAKDERAEELQNEETDEPTRRQSQGGAVDLEDVHVQVPDAQVLTFDGGTILELDGVDTTSFKFAAASTAEEDHDTASASSYFLASSSSATTTTLDPDSDHLYEPLRIQFDTRQLAAQMDLALSAADAIAASKLYLLIYEILPMTAQVWGDLLRVVPVTGGIYPLAARGSGADQLLPNDDDAAPADIPSGEELNFEDPVRRMYCPDETTSGIEGGADLLVYATVNRHCAGSGVAGAAEKNVESMGTLASALSCQRDQYDRPITGSIDFCLEGLHGVGVLNVERLLARQGARGAAGTVVGGERETAYQWDGWNGNDHSGEGMANSQNNGDLGDNREMIQYSVGVAVHELGHVLGVTSDSLAFFRHPLTGHPLTRRPFEVTTVTCVNGQTTPYFGMPGPATMQEGRHEGTGSRYFEIVTPTVRRVVRNHFNCQKMTGAKLENQPTSSDCFGSHFDEMLYYTEIMGAVFSQSVNILSPLTLALLEDSGWYRANYQSNYVQISMFGHGAGCDFVENNCIDSKGNVPKVFKEHFCNTPISISANGLIDTQRSGAQTCDPSHTQKTYCDLVNTNEIVQIGKMGTPLAPAPEKFQYFRPNLRPYIFTNADYCPVPHLDPQSCIVYNGRNPITSEQLAAGEYYGADSRCIETDGTRTFSLCLQTQCNRRLGRVQIMAGGTRRTCQYDGQVHKIPLDGGGKELRVRCPKAALVCPALFCPANCAGRGECRYRSGRGRGGDDKGTRARAVCICDEEGDTTAGCFRTRPVFPEVYGHAVENPHRADKMMFMVIVGSLVAGLAVMYVAARQWKARQNLFM